MKYIPLRVYSVYSIGNGVVDPTVLGDFLTEQNINIVAISDPFSLMGWESFLFEATERGMKPFLGIEIKIKGMGAGKLNKGQKKKNWEQYLGFIP